MYCVRVIFFLPYSHRTNAFRDIWLPRRSRNTRGIISRSPCAVNITNSSWPSVSRRRCRCRRYRRLISRGQTTVSEFDGADSFQATGVMKTFTVTVTIALLEIVSTPTTPLTETFGLPKLQTIFAFFQSICAKQSTSGQLPAPSSLPEKPSNILAFLPTEGKSHFFGFKPLLETLVARGHKLTLVSPFPLDGAKFPYRHVKVEQTLGGISFKIRFRNNDFNYGTVLRQFYVWKLHGNVDFRRRIFRTFNLIKVFRIHLAQISVRLG